MLDHLLKLRPFAYHICGTLNFESLRRSRCLRSSRDLLAGTGHEHLLSIRRKESSILVLPGGEVEIRDNAPLRLGSLDLEPGVTLEAFLQELNSRVFFWPGDERGPIPTGVRHFQHCSGVGDAHVLRVPLSHLLGSNPHRTLAVTFCNSGSARHQGGKKVIRGPGTFHPIGQIPRQVAQVKELTFVGDVWLPESTTFCTSLTGPWHVL